MFNIMIPIPHQKLFNVECLKAPSLVHFCFYYTVMTLPMFLKILI